MKKSITLAFQVLIFAALAITGIVYVMKTPPVKNLGDYEKQEMVRPNNSKSAIDNFFSPTEDEDGAGGDNVSLTGSAGRYDEVRIGKKAE